MPIWTVVATRLPDSPQRWYDLRNMLSEEEQPSDFVEMARQALVYARGRGLIQLHPAHAYLVRIVQASA